MLGLPVSECLPCLYLYVPIFFLSFFKSRLSPVCSFLLTESGNRDLWHLYDHRCWPQSDRHYIRWCFAFVSMRYTFCNSFVCDSLIGGRCTYCQINCLWYNVSFIGWYKLTFCALLVLNVVRLKIFAFYFQHLHSFCILNCNSFIFMLYSYH